MLKKVVIITLVFTALLAGVPVIFSNAIESFGFLREKPEYIKNVFRLKLTETDEIIEISAEEYVTGCIFAQIPVSYHDEALKAQATASYTYALRIAYDSETMPDSQTKDFDVSDDPVTCQPYFTEAEAREYYGDEYDVYYDRVASAAKYGTEHVIEYGGLPIYAVYHSVSNGKTNEAAAVWGRNFPYLKSVDSNWDSGYENFICVNEVSIDKMRDILLEYSKNISMPVDYNLWFTELQKNDAGYVDSVMAGDILVSGGDVWRIFRLRSTDFEVSFTGSVFEFTTTGYGHGVGMSQFGADYMANRGYSVTEILQHYYTGAEII